MIVLKPDLEIGRWSLLMTLLLASLQSNLVVEPYHYWNVLCNKDDGWVGWQFCWVMANYKANPKPDPILPSFFGFSGHSYHWKRQSAMMLTSFEHGSWRVSFFNLIISKKHFGISCSKSAWNYYVDLRILLTYVTLLKKNGFKILKIKLKIKIK